MSVKILSFHLCTTQDLIYVNNTKNERIKITDDANKIQKDISRLWRGELNRLKINLKKTDVSSLQELK